MRRFRAWTSKLGRALAGAELREAHERFRLAMEHAPIGMAIVDLDGQFLDVNPALCALTGYSAEELCRLSYADITHPDDLEASRAHAHGLVRGDLGAYSLEKRYVRPDGGVVWVIVSASIVRGEDGVPRYSIAQMIDVSQRKERERVLERRAAEDELTGVWNRRAFEEALGPRPPAGSLLLLDLDGLKDVNDTAGHAAGDAMLRTVAEVLRNRVRRSDWVARWGGDEFVVFLEGAGEEAAGRIARELERDLDRAQAPASVGVASTGGTTSAHYLLAAADEQMYARKRSRVRAA